MKPKLFYSRDEMTKYNVEKLKEVMPKDLGASEIGIKLGATWIPPEIIKDFIFDILNRIKDLNNSMVDYYIYNDKCLVNLFNYHLKEFLKQDITFVKDITYINVFNKLKDISNLIDNDNIDLAFSNIKELIEQFKDLYERNS